MTEDNNNSDGSWSFDIKQENLALDEKQQEEAPKIVPTTKKLKLDEQKVNPNRTRQELYDELQSKLTEVKEDIIDYAPIPLRGCACFIDLGVYMLTYLFANFLVPVTSYFFSIPMDRYKFVWTMSPVEVFKFMLGINLFFLINLMIVMPPAFFGASLGKRIVGIKVRGEQQFSIKYRLVFIREVFIKPISVLCIVGCVLPFFTKRKQSIHDFLCKTLVVID